MKRKLNLDFETYFNFPKILPFQRKFNFINSVRSLGKTYGSLGWIINDCIENNVQFVYIVRKQEEKKEGVFESATEKIRNNLFPDDVFKFTKEAMYLVVDEDTKIQIGWCLALSEAVKIKKRSFPNVKYMFMDEYMLEGRDTKLYVNGWDEPKMFLSVYHTIDREEDRVICFLMGNNTAFYNPYHMHEVFRIPYIENGQMWKSKNVLFWRPVKSSELAELKKDNAFLEMIDGSDYGRYAKDGVYVDDNYYLVEKMTNPCPCSFILEYNDCKYGIFSDLRKGRIYVSNKYDPSCKFSYALTLSDHNENTMLTKTGSISHLIWLSRNFKIGNVRYTSMEVKAKVEKGIMLLL